MNLKFRIKCKESKWWNGVLYYPQVKGGLLGKLGIWRYFNSMTYNIAYYETLLSTKTTLFVNDAVCCNSLDDAKSKAQTFFDNFKPSSEIYEIPKTGCYYAHFADDGTIKWNDKEDDDESNG